MQASALHVHSLQDGYEQIGRTVLECGLTSTNKRTGRKIKELLGYTFHIDDVRRSLPVGTGRKLKSAIGVVEALQLVGGWSDPQLQCAVSPNMAQFMDAGIFHGAYGLRLRGQIPALIQRLKSDATSRQAVLNIWDPSRDLEDGLHDLPCTLTLQFLIRHDELHLCVNMRSNDFWWGVGYDVFQFTQLQMTLAHFLDLDLGGYTHFAGSFHAYESDWDGIESLHAPDAEHPLTPGFASANDKDWSLVRDRTRRIVGVGDVLASEPHQWYVDQMRPYTPRSIALRQAIAAENARVGGLPD